MNLDTYKHQGLRRKLLEELKTKGITDQAVLQAMMAVPRHLFFTKEFEHFAYEDKAFPIEAGQTISQPFTVAMQSQLLEVGQYHKVLEIGTGSGYQCAVLCGLSANVFSIEFHKVLHHKAAKMLKGFGLKPTLLCGDGNKGLPAEAPYDRIMLTCGAAEIPKSLMSQLSVGGIMVIPVGKNNEDLEMLKLIRVSETKFEQSTHGRFRFVPLLGGN